MGLSYSARTLSTLGLLLVGIGSASANVSVVSTTETSAEPLTTAQVWKLDREEKNPHRRRWILRRDLDLQNVRLDHGKWVDGELRSRSIIHVRKGANWYASLKTFPCTKQRSSEFATEEGTLRAGLRAAELWDQQLSIEKNALDTQLKRLKEPSDEALMGVLKTKLESWFRDLNGKWWEEAYRRAREEEWTGYLHDAEAQKLCKNLISKNNVVDTFRWESTMDEPKKTPDNSLLARLPARRWNGAYSVRVQTTVAGKVLSGQFLLDPTTERNLVAQSWLIRQGVPTALVHRKEVPLEQWHWSQGVSFGKPIQATALELSGFSTGEAELWMTDLELYQPPSNFGGCCDGVLGLDFLRKYAVRFVPERRPEVELWYREGYSQTFGTPWTEASTQDHQLVSSCRVSWPGKDPIDTTLVWDLRKEGSLSGSLSPKAGYPKKTPVQLECSGQILSDAVPIRVDSEKKIHRIVLGADLLDRGATTLDLSNGRIWFSGAALTKAPIHNKSGLEVQFKEENEERILRVSNVIRGTPSWNLLAEGMGINAIVDTINGESTAESDQWYVERLLSGAYGDSKIQLKWKGEDGWKNSTLLLDSSLSKGKDAL